MKAFLMLAVAFFLCGCTYSINLIHSEGEATDMVDETQSPTANVPAGLEGIIKKLQA